MIRAAHHVPPRPEVVSAELWYRDIPYKDVMFQSIEGTSPDITNHFSDLTFRIVHGSGSIAVNNSISRVEAGSEITVPRAHAYRYSGSMDMLVDASPCFIPDFVTFNNQRLSRQARKEIKGFDRQMQFDIMQHKICDRIELVTDVLMRSQVGSER